MTVYTTLNKISAFEPCTDRWYRLLDGLGKCRADNEPLPLVHVLKIVGLNEALWHTRTVFQQHREKVVEYTIRCAESALPNFEKQFPNELAPKLAIQAAKDYLKCNFFTLCYFGFKVVAAENTVKEVAQFASWKSRKEERAGSAALAAWAAFYALMATRASMNEAYSCANEASKAAGVNFSTNLFREIFG